IIHYLYYWTILLQYDARVVYPAVNKLDAVLHHFVAASSRIILEIFNIVICFIVIVTESILCTELKEEHDYGPVVYDFEYSVRDPHTGDIKSQKESRKDDKVEGSYELIDSDGYRRLVTYKADDHNGFEAIVSREPTDIKIPLPAPQPEHKLLVQPKVNYFASPKFLQPYPLVHFGHRGTYLSVDKSLQAPAHAPLPVPVPVPVSIPVPVPVAASVPVSNHISSLPQESAPAPSHDYGNYVEFSAPSVSYKY
uniref:Uncharacterized protein n=1 Tax=Glossina palpalis gambiensis TaxID=67801 RepID=A0A1B0BLQ8_9MUSC